MSTYMKVAIGQMNGLLGDIDANFQSAIDLSNQAADEGARLIVLPEGILTGNALKDPAKQAVLAPEPQVFASLQEVADQRGIFICVGFAAAMGEKFNVVQAIIRPGEPMLFQRKAAKAPTEPFFLEPWPDATRQVFDIDGVRTVVHICSEGGNKKVEEATKAHQPDLLLHPSAGCLRMDQVVTPRTDAKVIEENQAAMRKCVDGAAKVAAERKLTKVASNPIGFDGETYWPGNAYAVDREGNVAIWMPGVDVPGEMKPSIAVADILIK